MIGSGGQYIFILVNSQGLGCLNMSPSSLYSYSTPSISPPPSSWSTEKLSTSTSTARSSERFLVSYAMRSAISPASFQRVEAAADNSSFILVLVVIFVVVIAIVIVTEDGNDIQCQ